MKLNNISLRYKQLSIAAVNLVFLIILGVIFYFIINKNQSSTEEIISNQKALYYFQDANLKNNTLRGDVSNLLLKDNSDKKTINQCIDDLTSHSIEYRNDISSIENLNVSKETQSLVNDIKPKLENYISNCISVGNLKLTYDSIFKANKAQITGEISTLSMNTDTLSKRLLKSKTNDLNNITTICDNILKDIVAPKLDRIESNYNELDLIQKELSSKILEETESLQTSALSSNSSNKLVVMIILFLFLLLSVFISLYISKLIQKPVMDTKRVIDALAKGDIPAQQEVNNNHEVGQMMTSLNNLTSNLTIVKNFADEVGQGKFDSEVNVFDGKGDLGTSLNNMRESLKNVAIEDNKRNWAITGVAQISDILRDSSNATNEQHLYDSIISYIVKYTNSNQGGLFLLNDMAEYDLHIELVACYAYNKKKFAEKRFEMGEGLVGQCYQEADVIYMTDVPDKYTTITSGLGEATPNCVVLVPLMINEKIHGVLELASFRAYEKHEIDFLKRLSETIASTISTIKVNVRTSILLEQTQQQAEEMRAQEEEMRQNLEELQATQEEFFRKEQSYVDEIERLKNPEQ